MERDARIVEIQVCSRCVEGRRSQFLTKALLTGNCEDRVQSAPPLRVLCRRRRHHSFRSHEATIRTVHRTDGVLVYVHRRMRSHHTRHQVQPPRGSLCLQPACVSDDRAMVRFGAGRRDHARSR